MLSAATCFYHVFKTWKLSNKSFGESSRHTPVSLLLAIVTVLAFIYPALLLCLHVFLIITGQTTREFVSLAIEVAVGSRLYLTS